MISVLTTSLFLLTSCSTDNDPVITSDYECCEEDFYIPETLRVYRPDTVYNQIKEQIKYTNIYIQLGAFVNKINAQEFADRTRTAISLNVKVRLFDDGYYKVITDEFTDIQTARIKLKEIKSSGFKDAFIRDDNGEIER